MIKNMNDSFQLNVQDPNNIKNPELGMITFDDTTNQFSIFNGNEWGLINNNTDFDDNIITYDLTNNNGYDELLSLLDKLPSDQLQQIYSNKDNLLIEIERLILSKI